MWGRRRNSDYYDYRDGPNNVARIATGTTIVIIAGGVLYCGAQLVVAYGWEGALNYIWEGDPYPNVRQYLDELNAISKTLNRETKTLNRLEEGLERARLDTIDSADAATILALWQKHVNDTKTNTQVNLQKVLAKSSYDLDRWAAKIDGIPGEQQANLKQKKKEISTRIVKLMDRTDILINFFDEASKPQEE